MLEKLELVEHIDLISPFVTDKGAEEGLDEYLNLSKDQDRKIPGMEIKSQTLRKLEHLPVVCEECHLGATAVR